MAVKSKGAVQLEAEPDVRYPSGSVLTAQHRDVIWVAATVPLRLTGRGDQVAAQGEPLLPVTEHTWCEIAADGDPAAGRRHGPALVGVGRPRPAGRGAGPVERRRAGRGRGPHPAGGGRERGRDVLRCDPAGPDGPRDDAVGMERRGRWRG